MAAGQNRMEERLQREDHFRKKALRIITEMTELYKQNQDETQEDTSPLVDEILHSIFFLGGIHTPPFPPEIILRDDDDENLLDFLRSRFPRPFQLYFCKVPKRSPFSCVLDMMVHLVGQENEEAIISRLQQFITEVEDGVRSKYLISTVICVSQKSDTSVRHYGVSMSTSGHIAREIMIAASCFSVWDDYVAGAVMTYYPEEKEEEEEEKKKKKKKKKEKKEKSKKSYFDGTIKIPQDVRCQAFNLRSGGEMNPCRSCSNMFGLNTDEATEFPYGNCAEAESLSNLLKNEREVKKESQPTSDTWTRKNIKRARKEVRQELRAMLCRTRFQWDVNFFNPQRSRIKKTKSNKSMAI